jgi:hypothetical protein
MVWPLGAWNHPTAGPTHDRSKGTRLGCPFFTLPHVRTKKREVGSPPQFWWKLAELGPRQFCATRSKMPCAQVIAVPFWSTRRKLALVFPAKKVM